MIFKAMEDLIKYYLEEFNRGGEESLKAICNLDVPKKLILEEYKKLKPIEELPEKDKRELKEYIIELFPEKTIEEMVNAAKIVYTIGSLI